MIPSIFISSTVADLHYLRDALRDAVEDLAYRPVMSDFGEVGYLAPTTAADSCYRTVAQCHMVVLIVGRRYGSVGKDGVSVTHREFLTARDKGLPIVTFVEADVLSFKQVYDADPSSPLWSKFDKLQNPKATFALLDDIRSSPTFNACIGFTSAGEAKRLLKLQIADFVGERLAEIVRPLRSEVQDVLAEVKSIRQELQSKSGTITDMDRFARILRALLDDRVAVLRKLLEVLFVDLDAALPIILQKPSFEQIVSASKHTLEVNDDKLAFMKTPGLYGHSSAGNYFVVTRDRRLVLSTSQLRHFESAVAALNQK